MYQEHDVVELDTGEEVALISGEKGGTYLVERERGEPRIFEVPTQNIVRKVWDMRTGKLVG